MEALEYSLSSVEFRFRGGTPRNRYFVRMTSRMSAAGESKLEKSRDGVWGKSLGLIKVLGAED